MTTLTKAERDRIKRMNDPVYRACGRKKKYATRALALAVARNGEQQTQRKNHRTVILRVYKCPYCKCWHLTRKRS